MLVIDTPAKLAAFLAGWRAGRMRRPQTLTLRLPSLTEEDCLRWQRRLNRDLKDCGCGTGAFMALLGGALMAVHWFRATELSFLSAISGAIRVVLATFIMGLLGKLIGLYLAKRDVTKSCTTLLKMYGFESLADLNRRG